MRIPTSFYRDDWWQLVAFPCVCLPFALTDSWARWLGFVPALALAWLSRRRRIEETGE